MRNGFQKFISGKGFYLALAVCLAGAGAAAWVAVDKTIENIETTPLSETPQVQQQADSAPAEQKLDNIAQDDSLSLQKEEPEDSTSAAADGDSAPADQSMKQQINADAGEQDDSSTQVSQDMLVKNETLGDWRTHNGIDISAATGTAVTAASDGIVTGVHSDPMWGNVVKVTSGEVVMTYAGLGDDIAVSVDQQVTAGEQLGSVGQIPCELSLEPHLHFDVQVNGDYVDPASLVE